MDLCKFGIFSLQVRIIFVTQRFFSVALSASLILFSDYKNTFVAFSSTGRAFFSFRPFFFYKTPEIYKKNT